MNKTVRLSPSQLTIVHSLLEHYLPGVQVWAYGSRTTEKSRPESDLDLVTFATPEQQANVSALREAFEEGNQQKRKLLPEGVTEPYKGGVYCRDIRFGANQPLKKKEPVNKPTPHNYIIEEEI